MYYLLYLINPPPSSSRHISLLKEAEFTVFALYGKKEFENELGQMSPNELDINDTIERNTSASYLYLIMSIGWNGHLHTSIYDKRCDFNFHIATLPFLSSDFNLRPPMAFLSRRLYDMPGFAPHINVFILYILKL